MPKRGFTYGPARLLIAASILYLSAGCAAPPSPQIVTTAETTTRAQNMSGVGNPFRAYEIKDRWSGNPEALVVTYDDQKHFFSGQSQINAYVRAVLHNGRTIERQSLVLVRQSSSSLYQGQIDHHAYGMDAKFVELAFFADGKWDSNDSRNYRVNVH